MCSAGLLEGPLAEAGVSGPTKGQEAGAGNFSAVVICFRLAYAIGMLAGRFIDWVGTREGYACSLIRLEPAAIPVATPLERHTWGFPASGAPPLG